MTIFNSPPMSWEEFKNIPNGTQVFNHGASECVALANQVTEGVLGVGFVNVRWARHWIENENVQSVHGFTLVPVTDAREGDIFVGVGGPYDGYYGHIGVVVRGWDGSTFGTMEQNVLGQYVSRHNRGANNIYGVLRPVNAPVSTPAYTTPSVGSQGEGIRAEGADWTYWVPGTADQQTVQSRLAERGYYTGPIDGNLASEASVLAIKLVCGDYGFFDLTYWNGEMNKNLCHGILLMAQTYGGYSGRMDWQIDGHVWAAFDGAVAAVVPIPAPPAPTAEVPPTVTPEPAKTKPSVKPEKAEHKPKPEEKKVAEATLTPEQITVINTRKMATDAQIQTLIATAKEIPLDDPNAPVIPDHIAKPMWLVLALLSSSTPYAFALTVIDWGNWDATVATQAASLIVAWSGTLASVLGLSRFSKSTPK